uniref:PHD-type domain-containing protein n=2 Tax=Oncorhynchus tshawytscha TaxID=74940 RepID=A0AAZ3RTN0_ONCTS
MSFMVALGLVTTETLEEIQTKRQERKRRSTANPAYSGLVQPERKRLASNYLNDPLFLSVRATGDYRWKEELEHDDHCSVCKGDGELQLCHNCPRAYHPDCLHPPLKTPPGGLGLHQVSEEGSEQREHVVATELCPVLCDTQDRERGGEEESAQEECRAEEGVCSPGGTGPATQHVPHGMTSDP